MTTSDHRRSVLITGCSSGIGLCVAGGLRGRGYRVIASARQPADVDRLKQAGFEALVLDLADPASVAAAAATVLDWTGGRLYALFNNGAFGTPGAVEDLPRTALAELFETNVFGTHDLTRRLIPAMRAQGEGRIIQNSSILGVMAMPYRGAYTASKYALEGLSDTLRQELDGTGIHVVLIQPGPILSRFRANAYENFKRHIDRDSSPHRDTYADLVVRFETEGAVEPFTLPPEAVLKRVIRALEKPRPRHRYAVTVPAVLFSRLVRWLPSRWIDSLLLGDLRRERRRRARQRAASV